MYAATDVAALHARLAAGFDRVVYVTDDSQAPHFSQVFQVARLAGWVAPDGLNLLAPGGRPRPVALEHAPFGLVSGPDGRKLSSRDGTELTLASLLEQASSWGAQVMSKCCQISSLSPTQGVTAVEEVMAQSPEVTREWTDSSPPVVGAQPGSATKDGVAAAVAHSAVRYFDLSHSRRVGYAFSYAKALATKGNTAAYLMYAVSRIRSLRRRGAAAMGLASDASWADVLRVADAAVAGHSGPLQSNTGAAKELALDPLERQLALTLVRLPEALAAAARSLAPHLVAAHAHELAADFHAFYDACRVLPVSRSSRRGGESSGDLALGDGSATSVGGSVPVASDIQVREGGADASSTTQEIVTARRLCLCFAAERVLVMSCGLLGVKCLERI